MDVSSVHPCHSTVVDMILLETVVANVLDICEFSVLSGIEATMLLIWRLGFISDENCMWLQLYCPCGLPEHSGLHL